MAKVQTPHRSLDAELIKRNRNIMCCKRGLGLAPLLWCLEEIVTNVFFFKGGEMKLNKTIELFGVAGGA